MTALGYCSRQVEGGRKLMGQSLVHPQRLGSLVGVSSCTLVRDEQGLVAHFQASCWDHFGLELCSISALFVGLHGPFFAWACSLLHEILEPTKWALKTCFAMSFFLLLMGFSF